MTKVACREHCIYRKKNGYNCTKDIILIKQVNGVMVCNDFKSSV